MECISTEPSLMTEIKRETHHFGSNPMSHNPESVLSRVGAQLFAFTKGLINQARPGRAERSFKLAEMRRDAICNFKPLFAVHSQVGAHFRVALCTPTTLITALPATRAIIIIVIKTIIIIEVLSRSFRGDPTRFQ